MVSPEDIEAIDILITQRQNEEASLDKEIKEEPVLKDGKQTDGSCDRTTGSGTDATDATDTQKSKQHKKIICRKLNNSNSNSNSEESASSSNSEDSDKSGKKSNSEESDKTASNSEDSDKTASNSEDSDKSGSNSDGSDKSDKNSNSEETSKESEVSVEEIEVPRKSFPIYDVDSNSNSDKTEDINLQSTHGWFQNKSGYSVNNFNRTMHSENYGDRTIYNFSLQPI